MRIAYFADADVTTNQCYGILLGSKKYTVTSSSATVGTPPTNAKIARIKAEETCVVSNSGSAASDDNGIFMEAGDIIDIEVKNADGTAVEILAKTTT